MLKRILLAWMIGFWLPVATPISMMGQYVTAGFTAVGGGGGTVTFDAVGPAGGAGFSQTSGSTTWTTFTATWTHVVASSTDMGLIAGCTFTPGTGSAVATIAATFNGTNMVSDGSVLPNNTAAVGVVYLFHLVAPSTGSHSVVATATYVSGTKSSNDGLVCGSISFSRVNQTAMTANKNSAYGSSGTPSVAITSATNDMVVDVVGTGSPITSSNQTIRWKLNTCCGGGGAANSGAESTAAGAASVTMSYVVTSDYWGIIGVDIPHD